MALGEGERGKSSDVLKSIHQNYYLGTKLPS